MAKSSGVKGIPSIGLLQSSNGSEKREKSVENSIKSNVNVTLFEKDRSHGYAIIVRDSRVVINHGCKEQEMLDKSWNCRNSLNKESFELLEVTKFLSRDDGVRLPCTHSSN